MRISAPVLPVGRILTDLAMKPGLFLGHEESAGPGGAGVPAPQVPANQTAQPFGSVNMLVALAASDPDRERRRRMALPAREGLDLLEDLHTEIVTGNPSPARLAKLAAWVRDVPVPEDETLAGLLAEIELRVRVELAKLDVEL